MYTGIKKPEMEQSISFIIIGALGVVISVVMLTGHVMA